MHSSQYLPATIRHWQWPRRSLLCDSLKLTFRHSMVSVTTMFSNILHDSNISCHYVGIANFSAGIRRTTMTGSRIRLRTQSKKVRSGLLWPWSLWLSCCAALFGFCFTRVRNEVVELRPLHAMRVSQWHSTHVIDLDAQCSAGLNMIIYDAVM